MIVNKNILNLLLISILICFSCVENKVNDDYNILEFILNEKKLKKEDSLAFNYETSNKRVISFFRDRNKDFITFKPTLKNGDKVNYGDSTNVKSDTVIYTKQGVKNNNYIFIGKGIDKDAEQFLKDSFDYKTLDSIKWNLSEAQKNIFTKSTINKSVFSVSKPVYNLNRNKSIIFTNTSTDNWRGRTLYFLEKINNKWILVYKENM